MRKDGPIFFLAWIVSGSIGVFCEDVDLGVTLESGGMVEPSCNSKSGFRLVCIGFFIRSLRRSIFATTKQTLTLQLPPSRMMFCALPVTALLLFPDMGVLHGIIAGGIFYDVHTLVEIPNLLLVIAGDEYAAAASSWWSATRFSRWWRPGTCNTNFLPFTYSASFISWIEIFGFGQKLSF